MRIFEKFNFGPGLTSVVLITLIIICMEMTEATNVQEANEKPAESNVEGNMDQHMVGMPLYRLKNKPSVLIPENIYDEKEHQKKH